MTINLKKHFIQHRKLNPNTNIAGYCSIKTTPKGGTVTTFYWCSRPSTGNLPAAAYVADYIESNWGNLHNCTIYTNLSTGHWITTYLQGVKTFNQVGDVYVDELENLETSRTLALQLFSGYNQVTSPIAGGGLYQAALDGYRLDLNTLTGRTKGMNRALRYYMLAAYALLGLCKQQGYTGGNYVSALLVNDVGQIISYGINNGKSTGSFHHAEVNMLLDYFHRNPNHSTYPNKTVVFSTLTPCQQCTKYISDARPNESVIFFGQMDTGKKGSVGTQISDAIDIITKPVRGSEWNQGKLNHFQIASGLQSCMHQGSSVAGQISNNRPSAYLRVALEHLGHKYEKARDKKSEEYQIKEQVIDYLFAWIESVKKDHF